jgi:hypothetical protein
VVLYVFNIWMEKFQLPENQEPTKKKPHVARAKGHVFFFSLDEGSPDLLHIYVRRLMSPEGAIEIFFSKTAVTVWNAERQRYETKDGEDGLYWYWLNEEKKLVWIVSCH